jgi:hypothetical protein
MFCYILLGEGLKKVYFDGLAFEFDFDIMCVDNTQAFGRYQKCPQNSKKC